MKKTIWILFVFFAITIGLYPIAYLLSDMKFGLLSSKSAELLNSMLWPLAFKFHIYGGAIAMLSGWSQFSKKLRNKNLKLHRALGKVYLIAVLLSGSAGLYLAFFATGGIGPSFGFGSLAILWLGTSLLAYRSITNKKIDAHEKWMIRSYALCFAAVTLRLWMPIFQAGLHMNFVEAYRIIAWLCWVPNLVVAEFIIARMSRLKHTQPLNTAL